MGNQETWSDHAGNSVSAPGWRRRSLLGALVAAPLTADGVLAGNASATSARGHVPPDTLPGGAYDRYVKHLADEGRFSGVVLLSHRGRTVLSRSYGMADEERGVPNRAGTAFSLSSAGKPFYAVAILQLAQQGKLQLSDTVGVHLRGFDSEVAGRVSVHHLLSGTSGLSAPDEDVQRVFHSRDEVHRYYSDRARESRLVGVPGLPGGAHAEPEVTICALIVEALSGVSYWDYVRENIFERAGMSRSGFFTRRQWLSDTRIAHPYMTLADGMMVDGVRHLDSSSPAAEVLGKNPGRAFIDAPGDGGFATAPDLVRFARALGDGTLLERPWADVLTAPKLPAGPGGFTTYGPAASIGGGQWMLQRAGGNPGVCANWDIYPDTGWVGVILANHDGVPLPEMIGQEMQAITGVPAGGGSGG